MNTGIHKATRTETIYKHVKAYIDAQSKEETFADNVVKKYHDLVPNAERRCVEFKTTGKPSRILSTNSQRLFRWFDKDVPARFPADLEEAVIESLPEPYRTECKKELTARIGGMYSPILEGSAGHAAIGDLLKQVGEAVERLGEIYEDGVANKKDRAKLPAALKELDDVIAASVALKALLIEQIDGKPALKAVK